jgi:hypothetical protein
LDVFSENYTHPTNNFASPGGVQRSSLLVEHGDGMYGRHDRETAGNNSLSMDFANPFAWRSTETSKTSKAHPDGEMYPANPTLK